jgi:hypothetical protein
VVGLVLNRRLASENHVGTRTPPLPWRRSSRRSQAQCRSLCTSCPAPAVALLVRILAGRSAVELTQRTWLGWVGWRRFEFFATTSTLPTADGPFAPVRSRFRPSDANRPNRSGSTRRVPHRPRSDRNRSVHDFLASSRAYVRRRPPTMSTWRGFSPRRNSRLRTAGRRTTGCRGDGR